jgi:hypothetical protein
MTKKNFRMPVWPLFRSVQLNQTHSPIVGRVFLHHLRHGWKGIPLSFRTTILHPLQHGWKGIPRHTLEHPHPNTRSYLGLSLSCCK